FSRYFESSGLFGTPQRCLRMVRAIEELGIDEIACLIDFGIDPDVVLDHLPNLNAVRNAAGIEIRERGLPIHSIPQLLETHQVTHLQCTPSLAAALIKDKLSHPGLRRLRNFLIGGEPLPAQLAHMVRRLCRGRILNMYGPTETTIWSAVHEIDGDAQVG